MGGNELTKKQGRPATRRWPKDVPSHSFFFSRLVEMELRPTKLRWDRQTELSAVELHPRWQNKNESGRESALHARDGTRIVLGFIFANNRIA